jgi:hypothetical protein
VVEVRAGDSFPVRSSVRRIYRDGAIPPQRLEGMYHFDHAAGGGDIAQNLALSPHRADAADCIWHGQGTDSWSLMEYTVH